MKILISLKGKIFILEPYQEHSLNLTFLSHDNIKIYYEFYARNLFSFYFDTVILKYGEMIRRFMFNPSYTTKRLSGIESMHHKRNFFFDCYMVTKHL